MEKPQPDAVRTKKVCVYELCPHELSQHKVYPTPGHPLAPQPASLIVILQDATGHEFEDVMVLQLDENYADLRKRALRTTFSHHVQDHDPCDFSMSHGARNIHGATLLEAVDSTRGAVTLTLPAAHGACVVVSCARVDGGGGGVRVCVCVCVEGGG